MICHDSYDFTLGLEWTEGDQDWDIPGPVGGPVDGPVGGPLGEPPPGGGRGEGTLQDIK